MKTLKAKFGKFAVSKKEADKIAGGFISIDPWGGLGGGHPGNGGGGSSEPRWACAYHDKQHPTPRTQICPNEGAARDFKRSMESLGYMVDCYCLC